LREDGISGSIPPRIKIRGILETVMKKLFNFLLQIYKGTLSFIFKLLFGGGCRFQPTCSEYAKESVAKFGIIKGTALALKRLSRCHPWGGFGYDPVPKPTNN